MSERQKPVTDKYRANYDETFGEARGRKPDAPLEPCPHCGENPCQMCPAEGYDKLKEAVGTDRLVKILGCEC
jgi:hypothetical protein